MINFEIFMLGVLVTSVFTGLVTEAIKNILSEHNVAYRANTLAGIVALVLSSAIGFGYAILSDINFTSDIVVCWVALIFVSWLCAMVGYDKVIQAISQFKTTRDE